MSLATLRAQAAIKAPAVQAPAPTPAPAPKKPLTPEEAEMEAIRSKIRVFKHPSAGSTTIMENGKVLTFVGPISGTGDRRVVGEGLIETDDPKEIEWLESVAKMPTNMVTEIKLDTSGQVAAVLTSSSAQTDASLQKAVAEAAGNTAAAVNDANDKNFTKALVAGTQTDLQAGATMTPDTSMRDAMQQAAAAGDQTKAGKVHNASAA